MHRTTAPSWPSTTVRGQQAGNTVHLCSWGVTGTCIACLLWQLMHSVVCAFADPPTEKYWKPGDTMRLHAHAGECCNSAQCPTVTCQAAGSVPPAEWRFMAVPRVLLQFRTHLMVHIQHASSPAPSRAGG